jgi:hypothetical protein
MRLFPDSQFERFTLDKEVIHCRLVARVSAGELFGILFGISLAAVFAWQHHTLGYYHPYDYLTYLQVAEGDLSVHYYAYWSVPIFQLLGWLPYIPGFIIWNTLNLLGVFFAGRVFGGKTWIILLTYQMLYVVFYGQIVGILIGGLALCWWGLANRRWHWAGLGLLIACTKYQLGLSLGLFLLLTAEISWRDRLRVLILPTAVTLITLVFYPKWPLTSLNTILNNPPNADGSISLWRWFGPVVLLLWLPPLLLPLTPQKRLIALATTTALAMPYFQQTDLLALFIFPVGWLTVAGNLGFLYLSSLHVIALQLLVMVPLFLYLALIGPELLRLLLSRMSLKR